MERTPEEGALIHLKLEVTPVSGKSCNVATINRGYVSLAGSHAFYLKVEKCSAVQQVFLTF